MKKKLIILFTCICFLPLISWGPDEYSAIALIAQRYLTAHAQKSVENLLGGKLSSADVIADVMQNRRTLALHFVNLKAGMNYDQFCLAVKSQTASDIYNEIGRVVKELSSAKTSKANKIFNIKSLVYLIADAHQPMHITRGARQSGSMVLLESSTKDANLNSPIDDVVSDKNVQAINSSSNSQRLAIQIDHASQNEIKQWQKDDVLIWLFESYTSNTPQVNGNPSPNSRIKITSDRLEKSGIRLAGVLNKIFH